MNQAAGNKFEMKKAHCYLFKKTRSRAFHLSVDMSIVSFENKNNNNN